MHLDLIRWRKWQSDRLARQQAYPLTLLDFGRRSLSKSLSQHGQKADRGCESFIPESPIGKQTCGKRWKYSWQSETRCCEDGRYGIMKQRPPLHYMTYGFPTSTSRPIEFNSFWLKVWFTFTSGVSSKYKEGISLTTKSSLPAERKRPPIDKSSSSTGQ